MSDEPLRPTKPQRPPASDQPPITGTWALISTEWRRADGRHANPFGVGAAGILTYDAAGNMSAQIMRAQRPRPPPDGGTGIEAAMAGAFAGYVAYFGTYEIDESAHVLRHHVAGSAFPAWVGMVHERRYRVDGDVLTLSQDFVTADGVAVAASTTWRQVG
jgi:hypothetical protein